jgi:hypothetical protein
MVIRTLILALRRLRQEDGEFTYGVPGQSGLYSNNLSQKKKKKRKKERKETGTQKIKWLPKVISEHAGEPEQSTNFWVFSFPPYSGHWSLALLGHMNLA